MPGIVKNMLKILGQLNKIENLIFIAFKDLGWTRFWHGWARIILTVLCDCVRNDGQIQYQLNFVSWLNVIDQQIPSNVLEIAVQL